MEEVDGAGDAEGEKVGSQGGAGEGGGREGLPESSLKLRIVRG